MAGETIEQTIELQGFGQVIVVQAVGNGRVVFAGIGRQHDHRTTIALAANMLGGFPTGEARHGNVQ